MDNFTGGRERVVKHFFTRAMPTVKKIAQEEVETKKKIPSSSKQKGKNIQRNLTKRQQVFAEIGQILAEIEGSLERLEMIPVLITSHSPYHEKRGFSRIQQHRRNIEWYFNEIYILYERVRKLSDILKKRCKNCGFSCRGNEIITIDRLFIQFQNSLEEVLRTRGRHVHDRSFIDEQLFHVELLEKAMEFEDLSEENRRFLWQDLLFDLHLDRRKWKDRIAKNNIETKKLLDYFYASLEEENKLISKILYQANSRL